MSKHDEEMKDAINSWVPPEQVEEVKAEVAEARREFDALNPRHDASVTNEQTGLDSATATRDEVGLDTESRVDIPVERPTVEYGGPDVPASDTIDYADLAANNPGPTPKLPPTETVVEGSEDVPEEPEAPTDTEGGPDLTQFNFGAYALLTKNDLQEVVEERLKDIETTIAKAELRQFELFVMEAFGDPELKEIIAKIQVLRTLQGAFLKAHTDYFGSE